MVGLLNGWCIEWLLKYIIIICPCLYAARLGSTRDHCHQRIRDTEPRQHTRPRLPNDTRPRASAAHEATTTKGYETPSLGSTRDHQRIQDPGTPKLQKRANFKAPNLLSKLAVSLRLKIKQIPREEECRAERRQEISGRVGRDEQKRTRQVPHSGAPNVAPQNLRPHQETKQLLLSRRSLAPDKPL